MPGWTNRVVISAPRNGTTDHTIDPSSASNVIDGAPFSPAAGRRLVVIAAGPVTSTTPSGWTLPSGGSVIGESGLYVWHRVAAGADTFTTTHNAANRPTVFVVLEYPAGTTFVGSVTATGQSTSAANPNLTGLSGANNSAIGVAVWGDTVSGGTTGSATWSSPNVTLVDVNVDSDDTAGIWLGVAYQDPYSSASYQPTPTITSPGGAGGSERMTFALNVPPGAATYTRSGATVVGP